MVLLPGQREGGLRHERGRQRMPLLHLRRHRRLSRVDRLPRRRMVIIHMTSRTHRLRHTDLEQRLGPGT